MNKWIRVSKDRRCPICDHADWCLVTADGTAAICPRIEQGSVKRCGDAGWLHKLADSPVWRPRFRKIAIKREAKPPVDVTELAAQYQAIAAKTGKIDELADVLGLSPGSLTRFGVGYSPQGWFSWPMANAEGRIVGITRRFADGSKKITPGHKAGLYVPDKLPGKLSGLPLLICEGATDAVTGLDLGFWSVGRFSCAHGLRLLTEIVKARRPGLVVIIGDADAPGRRGAESAAAVLLPYVACLKVIEPLPPHEDLRSWRRGGATIADVNGLIEAIEPRRLSVKVRYT